MKASILDLRRHMREILRALELNETVTLTHRGKEKAKIVPTSSDRTEISARDHPAFGLWKDRGKDEDVNGMIRDLRRGRFGAL